MEKSLLSRLAWIWELHFFILPGLGWLLRIGKSGPSKADFYVDMFHKF